MSTHVRSSVARGLKLCLSLHPCPYFVPASTVKALQDCTYEPWHEISNNVAFGHK